MVETNGIHITASRPVAVYALDYDPTASAAFTAYPTPLLGTNYCLMAYPGFRSDLPSEFSIVATEDNTTVRIAPAATADLVGGYANAYYLSLNQGQTYQNASLNGGADVTGTWIVSDKPIGVFAGDGLAFVPDLNTWAGNPLVQEQLPVEQWGMQALSMGFAGRTKGDTYRILAANDNTVVRTNGVVAGTNQAGQCLEMIIDGPVEFQGSKPIQVAQFANGYQFDNPPFDYGDPCEILLPPTGHYLITNTIATPAEFPVNYLNIIVAQSAITNTLVDSLHISATNFVTIGTSGYSGAQLSVANGMHKVTSSQPVEVQVYGFGDTDAYGYFGGLVK